jgi:hypothetical protein
MASCLIPRRVTITTGLLLLISFALAGAHGLLFAALDDAQNDLREAELHVALAEGRYTECREASDRWDTILTQCIAWQGRLSLDIEAVGRACDPMADGGAW